MNSNREGAHILQLTEMKERFVAQGIDLASSAFEAFGALIKAKVPKWRNIVKDAGGKVPPLLPEGSLDVGVARRL